MLIDVMQLKPMLRFVAIVVPGPDEPKVGLTETRHVVSLGVLD